MISVITYGRNDDRGYGMTKRVAIGLNTLARQVDARSGEVLFVDYNTPDHLPTLPELIWDTLTHQARRRLRILRVRPAHHSRFADRTPLAVLEPVARNVALRRANPANRWILSTNTDALLAPPGGTSLIGLVESLAPGQYGLPRFELPERAWEGFARADPDGCVALARAWGREARLREIVRGVPEVAFDNPGDFQLVPREDLVAIGGFEEEMLLGWHVDHNLAKRMAMRLGPIRSLEARLELYHLGHARGVVPSHSYDRSENDIVAFVEQIDRPEALHAAHSWGLADDDIEEIRLDVAPGEVVRAACRALMPSLEGKPLEAVYAPESFDAVTYDAGHVAAHLLDLLSTFPSRTAFAYAGLRRDLLDLVREGLPKLGFSRRLLVPRSLAEALGAASRPDLQIGDDAAILRAADVLVFAFGIATGGGAAASEEQIAGLLEEMASLEEERRLAGNAPRMIVTVGLIHTRFERLLAGRLAASASPLTTRLRYGPIASGTSVPRVVERDRAAGRWVSLLTGGGELSREQICELSADAALVRSRLEDAASAGASGALFETARLRLREALRPHPMLSGRSFGVPSARIGATGPARADSWDDPRFAADALRLTRVRNGWAWERARMLGVLTDAGLLRRAGRILAVIEHEEPLLEALALRVDAVDAVDARSLGSDPGWEVTPLIVSGHARVVGRDALAAGSYDAVVAPHASLFGDGVAGLGARLCRLGAALRPGGTLLVGGEICLLERERGMRPTLAAAGADGFPALCGRLLGLSLVGDEGWGLRPDDLVRIGHAQDSAQGMPILGIVHGEDVLWPAVWVFERREGVSPADADEIDAAFRDLILGEQIGAMSIGAGARREAGAVIVGEEPGHALFGPYLHLSPGRYVACVTIDGLARRAAASGEGRVVVEVAFGENIVAQETLHPTGGEAAAVTLPLPFDVPGAAEPCEVRVWSDGAAVLRVLSIVVSRWAKEGDK